MKPPTIRDTSGEVSSPAEVQTLLRMDDETTRFDNEANYVMQDMTCDANAKIPSKSIDYSNETRYDESCDEDITVTVNDANHSSCNHHQEGNKTSDENVLRDDISVKRNGKSHGSRRTKILAVETKNICFKYRSSPSFILSYVSMQIPEGTIYGLLGPSGCGKTSLLRCILNQLRPASGSISIFDSHPGDKGSLIPGPGVGYMPQEIALVMEFTIFETVHFFGKLHGMKKDQLEERSNFLLKFLDLPDGNRLVRDLSGGQRRRVSLAAALVHSPPLLVLDEPTVGVDPLLRETIWEHLVSLAEEEHMTIIITTHYIEEARRAHTVGFLRRGKLLVQDHPDSILQRYGINSLELAFLKICSREQDANTEAGEEDEDAGAGSPKRDSIRKKLSFTNSIKAIGFGKQASISPSRIYVPKNESEEQSVKQEQSSCHSGSFHSVHSQNNQRQSSSGAKGTNQVDVEGFSHKSHKTPEQTFRYQFNIVKTLASKGVIKFKRSIPELLFNIVTPAIQVILFCIAIGQMPRDLQVAVYNPDQPPPTAIHYSRNFLDQIDSTYIHLTYYDTLDAAVKSVKSSASWAAVEFPKNYSYWLDQRMSNIFEPNDQIINGSTIRLHADMTEYPIQMLLAQELLKAMGRFGQKIVNESNVIKFMLPWNGEIPPHRLLAPPVIAVDPPVYGHFNPDYREFTTPGFMLGIIYIVAVGMTAISLVQERKDGILERSLVAGVRSIHIILAHVWIQFCMVFLQGVFLFLVLFQLFMITVNGSTIHAFFLLILQGAAGMSMGFMVSSICHEERPATMLSLALFFPNLILSGLVWPIEGMPYVLRVVSYFLPQTMAIKSMRSIISRGLGIGEWQVYIGFISSISWALFFILVAIILFASDRRY